MTTLQSVYRFRALVVVVLAGLLGPAAAGAPSALPHARTFVIGSDIIPSKDPVWGAVGDGDDVATLQEVDPSSARPIGRGLRLADLTDDEPLISPDRRVIALGSAYNGR